MYGSTSLDSGKSVMFAYAALSVGDIFGGFLCQWLKSRKKGMLFFYLLGTVVMLLFFSGFNNSDSIMYFLCAMLGFANGYWAIFVTMGAEQFGTNLRATAATTIPNMVRGVLPLLNLLFLDLFQKSWGWTLTRSGMVTGILVTAICFIALYFTKETYHKDLNYTEQ